MNRPVHFEIHADDCDRAEKFYTELFGWQFKKWEGSPTDYRMIVTGDKESQGINGGLLKRMGATPSMGAAVNAYVCTMDVTHIDEMHAKAIALGGSEALPKMPIPGMGWLSYCKDQEGNIFGLMQPDSSAK